MIQRIPDNSFMKVKDAVLLLGAIAGGIAWVHTQFFVKPMMTDVAVNEIKQSIVSVKSTLDERSNKYFPMVERHETELAVIRAEIRGGFANMQDNIREIRQGLEDKRILKRDH